MVEGKLKYYLNLIRILLQAIIFGFILLVELCQLILYSLDYTYNMNISIFCKSFLLLQSFLVFIL